MSLSFPPHYIDTSVDDSGATLIPRGVGPPDKPQDIVPDFIPKGDERILFVDCLSSELNCAKFFEMFGKYGKIKVIKFCETDNFDFWKLWVEYVSHEDAFSAFKASSSETLKCRLISRVPPKTDVDVVYPERISDEAVEDKSIERSPLPAR